MFLIDQYKNLINNSESNEEILNNIYNSTSDKLLKLEKIKKKKDFRKKIDILKKNRVNISHMIFYGKKGNSKEIIVNNTSYFFDFYLFKLVLF